MNGAGTETGIEHAASSEVWLRHTLEEIAAVSAMVRFFVKARTWDHDCPAQVLAQAKGY